MVWRRRELFGFLLMGGPLCSVSLSCSTICQSACPGPESFVRGGPALTTFLEGREDPNQTNATIHGPSSSRSDDDQTLNADLAAL